MKSKIAFFLVCAFLFSCTSNTIFEKPKDLIPKDSMSLLLQEMMIVVSAKFIKNKNDEKNVNYMPYIYDKYKIDSTRFNASNYYYMSKIDLYKEILEGAKESLEKQASILNEKQTRLDSIKKDSLKRAKIHLKKTDSLKFLLAKAKDSTKKKVIKKAIKNLELN